MTLPLVAIVGRPNVGKSSLFNVIAGRRRSIVDPTAGVTRDRVTAICDIEEAYFELVDTGGHGIVDRDDLNDHVERQILYAINQAHLILLVVDGREGVTPLDRATGDLLRHHRQADRVRVLANKVDAPHMEAGIGEFGRLGFGEPLAVSAVTGRGRAALRELIREAVAGAADEVPPDPVMKIAVVGKRNAGKSSFINALVGEERVIVSEIPGTTRDSIDVRVEKDGRTIVVIDTAGVRKKSKIADDVEFYAYSRVIESIGRADAVLFLIDATLPVGQVDKRLAGLIADELKPCVLVVNKWDLAKGSAVSGDYGAYLDKVLPQVSYAPVAFTSAITGRNVYGTIDLATELVKQSRTRVTTGRLNQVLRDAVALRSPRVKHGSRAPKFYYAAQISVEPPTIVVFVNGVSLVTKEYGRFLVNRLRETLPFAEIPIRLIFRSRRGESAGSNRTRAIGQEP